MAADAARCAGNIPWLINRPYFDLAAADGSYPLHAYDVMLAAGRLERGEPQGLGPNMTMVPVFRRILVAEAGMPEYQASKLDDLPPALRSPAWDNAAEFRRHAENLADQQKLALGRVLVALTFYDEAVTVLRMAPAADPSVDATAGAVVAAALTARYVAGGGSRAGLVREVAAALRTLPRGRVPAISTRLLQVALCARRGLGLTAIEEYCAPLHDEVAIAREVMPERDWRRLRARVLAMHAKLLTTVAPAESARRLREAEDCLDVTGGDDDPLFSEARRRLLDRHCLVAQRLGDLGQARMVAAEAVRIDPVCSKAWLQLGNVQVADGEDESALRSYRRAAALGPLFSGMACYLAGRMLDRLDRRDEALHEYLRAARLEPGSRSVTEALAEDARLLGNRLAAAVAEHLHYAQQRTAVPVAGVAS